MTTHTLRRGRKLRYYVSNRLIRGGPDPTGWRLPAPQLEEAIAHAIADHIATANASHCLLSNPDIRDLYAVQMRADEIAQKLGVGEPTILRSLVASGTMGHRTISLTLDSAVLAHRLGIATGSLAPSVLLLAIPLRLKRRGVEMKVIAGATVPAPDPVLKAALANAHRWARALKDGNPLIEIARDAGHHESLVRTRTPLAFLSPKIQRAILEGSQPVDLTLERLVRQTLPLDWLHQERLCGF